MKLEEINPTKDEHNALERFISQWNDDSSSILQHTSGSTGKPKAIEIPKWKMEASARMTGSFLQLDNCKSALLCMSLQYIGGKMMVVRSLLYNLTLYVARVDSNPLKDIDFPIDFVAMVPLQVETTLRKNPAKLNLITHLIIGGAPVSDQLTKELRKYDCHSYATFGMTETVSHIALRDLTVEKAPYAATGAADFSTKDDCLVISSKELKIKELQTTDSVEIIDKTHFYWKGRTDFVINSGGVKIHPEEVERKISNEIHAHAFIIASLPDEKLGMKVIFIGEESLQNISDLSTRICACVDRYEKPKAYFFIDRLIKTEAGKIDRLATAQVIEK